MIVILLKLLMGHALADFALQSDWMAKAKNRHFRPTPPPGQQFQAHWFYVLGAHSLIHGAAVWFATGMVGLGLAETVAHAAIDFGKCENRYGIHVDQGLHILCKVLWMAIYAA